MSEVIESIFVPAATVGAADHFDMTLLSSRITSVDSLLRKINDQQDEIGKMKKQMQSFNESAQRINQSYQQERELVASFERKIAEQSEHIKQLDEQLDERNNEIINTSLLHAQTEADLEHRLDASETDLVRICQFSLAQWNLLVEHQLTNPQLFVHYKRTIELLDQRSIPYRQPPPKCKKKKCRTIETQTQSAKRGSSPSPPPLPSIASKSVSDKSTMHFQTTATRGTNTVAPEPVCTSTIGTMFPEPISIEDIFRLTICKMPKMVSPIADWPTETCGTQTDLPLETTDAAFSSSRLRQRSVAVECHDAGTMTRLQNVRKRITYNQNVKRNLMQQTLAANRLCAIKKEEKESPMGSMSNLLVASALSDRLAGLNGGTGDSGGGVGHIPTAMSQINPQLMGLWQLLGDTIFGLVGSGRVFDQNSPSMDLINAKLNEIRKVVLTPTQDIEDNQAHGNNSNFEGKSKSYAK